MATNRDILGDYRPYRFVALLSTLGISLFQLVDRVAPNTVRQILNVRSDQPVDGWIQPLVNGVVRWSHHPSDRCLTWFVLFGAIFLVTVVKAPIQPWVSSWLNEVWHYVPGAIPCGDRWMWQSTAGC